MPAGPSDKPAAEQAPDQSVGGRYGISLPVIRPIPARALVAGLSAIVLGLTLFGFIAEYGRKELVAASVEPRGGMARVTSPASATVLSVLVSPGDVVQAGTALVALTTDQTYAKGTLSDAATRALEERTQAAQDELTLTAEEVEVRRSALRAQRTSLQRTTQLAEAETAQRGQVVQRLKADLARRQELVRQGFIAEAALDQHHIALATAEAEHLASQRATASMTAQLQQLDAELAALATRQALAQSQKKKELAELRQEQARTQTVARQYVPSRIDGTVAAVSVSSGESLNAGQLVAVVAPKGAPLEAVLLIPSTSVASVKPGRDVNLRLAAYPYETFGYVPAVIRSVDSSPTAQTPQGMPLVRAYAQINSVPDGIVLQPGMTATAAVEVERRTLLAWMLWPLLKNFLG